MTDPAASALSKQKLILALLDHPDTSRKYLQFRDCLHHIPHYISRLYSRTRAPETSQIRCALKHKCPKCMDDSHVESARRPDFRIIAKAARALGGGELGEDCKVWLLSARTDAPLSGRKLARILSRGDSRRRPALLGKWGGESAVAGPFKAIVSSNSPKESRKSCKPFAFNALIFSVPEGDLDESRLASLGITVERFHRRLGAAWQAYLRRWATEQITQNDPEEVVRWMIEGRRTFETLGSLRGVKARDRAEHIDKLHETCGKSVRIGFFHRLNQPDDVIARIDYDLPLNASNLLNYVLSASERHHIMSLVTPQVRSALSPPMTEEEVMTKPMTQAELRTRLEELREQQALILAKLDHREQDSTTTRKPKDPREVM